MERVKSGRIKNLLPYLLGTLIITRGARKQCFLKPKHRPPNLVLQGEKFYSSSSFCSSFLIPPPLLLLFCFRSSFSRHHYLSHLSLVMHCLFNNNPQCRNATTAAASSRRPGDEEARAHNSVYFVSILLLLLRRILRNLSKQVFLEIPFKVSSHCNRQSVVGHDWHGYFWGQVNSGPYWQQQQLL